MNRRPIQLTAVVAGYSIQYRLSENGVHILSDSAFRKMMSESVPGRLSQLVAQVYASFQQYRQRPFQVKKASFKMEVYGHFYMELFLEKLDSKIPKNFLRKIRRRLLRATERIDIAEWGHDSNRWIWDISVPFLGLFEKILKRR